MIKAAIEKIEAMSKPQIQEIDGHTYAIQMNGDYREIRPELDLPKGIHLNSLDALVTMIRFEGIKFCRPIYVSALNATTALAVTELLPDKRMESVSLYEAKADDTPGWGESVKMPFDQAAVALQTRFQNSADRDYCLQLLSNITTGAKVTYNDTGVATTVVTQKGVALQQNQAIKPLVRLRPYRTFQEIEQPEGLFLIRIDERGITFTEVDGGMWKLEARKTICAYLTDALAPEIEKGLVKIML